METYFKQLEIHVKAENIDAQAECWFKIAKSLDYLGNSKESINAFKNCLTLKPKHFEANQYLGSMKIKMKLYQ